MPRLIPALAGLLWLAIQPARAEILWHWEDRFSDAEKAKLEAWITRTAAGVGELVAPYPFDIHITFHRAERGDSPDSSPVPWAHTVRSRRQGVDFHVDPERTLAELFDDWTAPHELSHLLIPYVGRRHAWFAEGFASYMQYQVMHSMGILDDEQMTARYRAKIGEAKGGYDLHDSTFAEAASELVARREYPTMYWGGAVYFLQVDQRLRERGTSMLGVLRQFVECCRSSTRGLDRLLAELDRIADEPVFSERLEILRTQRGFPDDTGIWRKVAPPAADRTAPPYPLGPDSIPLLHEVWAFSAGRIYPSRLSRRFDASTLAQMDRTLRAGESVPVADVLNPFLQTLGVSHTRFYDRRHQTWYMLRSLFATRNPDTPSLYTIGIQLDENDAGLVRAVMEGSPAAAARIHRGDRIVAVDGRPFESLLQWQHGGAVDLTIAAHPGARRVRLAPVRQGFHRALARATAASHRIFDCRERRLGYLHLWSGTHEIFLDTLKEAVASARASNLDGFVLDLRDGYGGAWWPYLDPFFPDRSGYFTATRLDRRGERTVTRAEPQENPEAWTGPLAVITNSGTRSGKESLAFQFKKSGRAKLFGSTTAGAFTGGHGAYPDRDVDYLLYLAVAELLLDGIAIEGAGVSPDEAVPDVPERDAPLASALGHLGCEAPSAPEDELEPLALEQPGSAYEPVLLELASDVTRESARIIAGRRVARQALRASRAVRPVPRRRAATRESP